MKNKYNYFVVKTILKMFMYFAIAFLIISFALFLHSKFFAWDLAMVLKSIGIYSFIITNKVWIICISFCFMMVLAFCLIINRFSRYLSGITTAIENIFSEEVDVIKLPSDLVEMEDQLNSINKNLKLKTLQAKESEQRKHDLIVYLAHDLKTPLASVIGYLNLLDDEPNLPTEVRAKYIGITLDRAQRLEELINEFFDITKYNLHNIDLDKTQINISMMLRQIIDEFYPLFSEHNIICEDNIASNLSLVGDGDKLARVFDNLLRNAINYSYTNSKIKINADEIDHKLVLTFSNQGDVISESKLEMIFEKFYRLDSSRSSSTGGSGLGLAISKEIVRLHGGSISATSTTEATVFTVVLPCTNIEVNK